jgi:hypothetical protein
MIWRHVAAGMRLRRRVGRSAHAAGGSLARAAVPIAAANRSRASPHRAQAAFTPLATAANHGHLEVVRLLLERGADKNVKSNVRARCVGARRVRRSLAQSACRSSAAVVQSERRKAGPLAAS